MNLNTSYANGLVPTSAKRDDRWRWGPFSGVEQRAERYHRGYVAGREHLSPPGQSSGMPSEVEPDEVKVVDKLGPAGFYFLTVPDVTIRKMSVTYVGGKRGLIEPTLQGDRLRIRLEKGLNRIEVTVAEPPQGEAEAVPQSKRPQARTAQPTGRTIKYFLVWTGS